MRPLSYAEHAVHSWYCYRAWICKCDLSAVSIPADIGVYASVSERSLILPGILVRLHDDYGAFRIMTLIDVIDVCCPGQFR